MFVDSVEKGTLESEGLLKNPVNAVLVTPRISIPEGMKTVSKIAFPMMASFSMSFIMLATAIYSGHLNSDEDHIAATALITVVANAISAITFGPLFSVGITVSKAYGDWETTKVLNKKNQKRKNIAHYNKNGIFLAVSSFWVPTLILAFSKPILITLGQNPKVAAIAQQYLGVFSIAMFAWGWRVVNEQIMFSFRKATPTAVIGLTDFAITTTLAYLLGFGKLFPKMGIKGVAIAFTVEAYLTMVLNTLYIMIQKDLRFFKFFREWQCNRARDCKQIATLLKISLPMFLTFINEFGVQMMMNFLMGILGNAELAAQNFMAQFFFFTFIPLISFAQATSQEFSRAYGGKQFDNARRIAIAGLITAVLVILPFVVSVSIYPEWMTYLLVNQSGKNTSWFHILRVMAPISASGVLLDAIGFNMLQVLRSVDDNVVSSVISGSTLWVGILASYLLGFKAGYGAYGVAAGYTGGLFLRASILFTRWITKTTPKNLQKLSESQAENKNENFSSFFRCCKTAKPVEASYDSFENSLDTVIN